MKKDEEYQNLERINFWISNVDTKISYLLAFIGIITTIIFTNDNVVNTMKKYFTNILTISVDDIINMLSIVGIILILLMIFFISRCIFYLLKASTASITSDRVSETDMDYESIMFFGSISKNKSYKDFKEIVKQKTDEDINDDILKQIYINSVICNKKFENYNKAIKDIKKSLIILIFVIIIILVNI